MLNKQYRARSKMKPTSVDPEQEPESLAKKKADDFDVMDDDALDQLPIQAPETAKSNFLIHDSVASKNSTFVPAPSVLASEWFGQDIFKDFLKPTSATTSSSTTSSTTHVSMKLSNQNQNQNNNRNNNNNNN